MTRGTPIYGNPPNGSTAATDGVFYVVFSGVRSATRKGNNLWMFTVRFWLANISCPSILQSHAEGGLQHAIIQASSNDTRTQAAVHQGLVKGARRGAHHQVVEEPGSGQAMEKLYSESPDISTPRFLSVSKCSSHWIGAMENGKPWFSSGRYTKYRGVLQIFPSLPHTETARLMRQETARPGWSGGLPCLGAWEYEALNCWQESGNLGQHVQPYTYLCEVRFLNLCENCRGYQKYAKHPCLYLSHLWLSSCSLPKAIIQICR